MTLSKNTLQAVGHNYLWILRYVNRISRSLIKQWYQAIFQFILSGNLTNILQKDLLINPCSLYLLQFVLIHIYKQILKTITWKIFGLRQHHNFSVFCELIWEFCFNWYNKLVWIVFFFFFPFLPNYYICTFRIIT